ncbi:MAG TPA: hypothetical protein VE755_09175 [Myxococcales bacterium]|nr:hypothetical protein [Myxococcales bacterium]
MRGPDVQQSPAARTQTVESVENDREVAVAKTCKSALAGALVDGVVGVRLADARFERHGLEPT